MNRPLPTNRLSLRIDLRNPDHHLWNNNGTWWCHFTLHTSDNTKHRIRRSLRTNDRSVARARRDELLGQIQPQPGGGSMSEARRKPEVVEPIAPGSPSPAAETASLLHHPHHQNALR